MIYGPKLFSLIERLGDDPRVAANGVVAGDSFGNGHFLTSGGAMTGMVGHGFRVLGYRQARAAGATPSKAIRKLADAIKDDTHAWLHVSAKEYSQALPVNFGAEPPRGFDRLCARVRVRATGRVDLLGAGATVSRRHARIRRVNGGFEVEDLGSLNHTELRGEVLPSGQAHALKDGETIRFGSVEALSRIVGTSDLPVPSSVG